MIVVTVEMPGGDVLSIAAETPEMFPGIRDFPVEVKVKSVLVEMVRALCSTMQISPDLTDTLPMTVHMKATLSTVAEAEEELRFQAALDRAPVDTAGSRAAARIGDFINDGADLSVALGQLSDEEREAALEYFINLKTDSQGEKD